MRYAVFFTPNLHSGLNDGQSDKIVSMLIMIKTAIRESGIGKFFGSVNILFENISCVIADNREKYFHSVLFYTNVEPHGFSTESKVITIDDYIV